MAIQWGGYTNHLRVGIDVWTDGYDTNTPSINVYAAFYVGTDHWTWNDDQVLVLGGSIGGSWGYHNSMGYDGVIGIGTYTIYGQGQNYNGGPTYTLTGTVTGSYLGAGPSTTVYFTLPARPPNIPTPPGIGVDSVTPNGARILVYAADGRGAGVDAYETVTSLPGGDWSAWTNDFGGGTGTVSNLQPNTYYACATRAHNYVGWSDWAFSSFTTGGTAPSTPSGLSISNLTTSGARLSWTAPSDNGGAAITSYDVQRATNSAFTTGLVTVSDPASPYDFTGLASHTTYYVRTRAINSIGPSGYSATASFTTNMAVTATVPAGNKNAFTTVTLTGTDANDSTVASRQWTQTAGTPTVTLSGATGTTPSFYAPGTLAGTTLTFKYTVTDTSSRIYSATVSVVVNKVNHKAVVGGVEVPMDFRAN